MKRYLYKNSEGDLYSLGEFVPSVYLHENDYTHHIGSVNINNEIELKRFLETITEWGEYTEEDILKALRFEEYKLMSKKIRDFIEAPESGTNEIIEELVNDVVAELGGDSYCSSVYDSLNERELCDIHDFGNEIFYKTVEKIINVTETFEEGR